MSITLDIPNNIHEALHVPPEETEKRLKLELAVALYAQNALGLGKAAELAGMSRMALNDILAERGIPMHYGQKDLEEDLAYARSCQ
jgi:predicted HTH domain antitoxin